MSSQGKCNLCDGTGYDPISSIDRHGEALNTVICVNCGLVQTHPMPNEAEMAEFYRLEYRKRYKKSPTPPMKHIYRSAHRCLARLEKAKAHIKANMHAVDLGSGAGEFVFLLKTRGLQVQGIEPSEGYGGFAKNTLGLDIQIKPIEKAEVKEESLDIITAHHVIEHMVDPLKSFQTLAKWLKPGGKILAEVPNINSRMHAPSRRFHFAHIYNFSPETFVALGKKAGLEVEEVQIEPGTDHIFAVFTKNGQDNVQMDLEQGLLETRNILRKHTEFSHHLSAYPYSRFFNNLRRPFHEKSAISGQTDPKELLQHIYDNTKF
ncbi:MAG: class I SAM-dependent methyltransferase [Robiginitomaculum sp.]|nr:class I SAM-dependent methyltransferase [Robiginitomaculum sp.]